MVVFVAGQPGAGKTMTTASVRHSLGQRGGATVVNSDFYKPYHPAYGELLRLDDRNAAACTSTDGRRWMAAAERYLIHRRINAIVETTMRDPGDFLEPAARFRAAGYRVEAAIIAVPEALSRLGIIHRYHQQVRQLGRGRLTARGNHDASYRGVLRAAGMIDADRLDAVAVYRRGNHPLHLNHLHTGTCRRPTGTAAAVDGERRRVWSGPESTAFATILTQLAHAMGPEWHGELRDIIALAAPLADLRTPLPRVPGRR